jgi:hypothetical protein
MEGKLDDIHSTVDDKKKDDKKENKDAPLETVILE